ncbi:MAG: NAD-dependent deacylase [Candidatus Omnitrophota bacterium]
MTVSKEIIDYIKKRLRSGKITCLTGAGISYESGVPTFRGKGGLWEKYDPQVYAYPEGLITAFYDTPQNFVDFCVDFYGVLLGAGPNPAHLSLAEMERLGLLSSVITQNVDNLHIEAGSRRVIELHGNAYRRRCIHCRKTKDFSKEEIKDFISGLKKYRLLRPRLLRVLSKYFGRCPSCRGRNRIDIVLFGEELPLEALHQAHEEIEKCSLLFLIGTSGIIYPAAGLPALAKSKGRGLIEINTEASALNYLCDYTVKAAAVEVIPQILEKIK